MKSQLIGPAPGPPLSPSGRVHKDGQWHYLGPGRYRSVGTTTNKLPAGSYQFMYDSDGLYIQSHDLVTDSLLNIDSSTSSRVLNSICKFWDAANEYHRRGVLHKRGILLYGPAGSGKTSLLALLSEELVKRDGLTFLYTHYSFVTPGLQELRAVEPDRPIIMIYEDLDELLEKENEHLILGLLDGVNQVNNVTNLATTNHPERLGPRILNRPSRFDERILVDLPDAAARRTFLEWITRHEPEASFPLETWVQDTEGLGPAHLRELALAVFCLGQSYPDVLQRLRSLRAPLRPVDEMRQEVGF